MRTIKFRAKTKQGEWVYGNYVHHYTTYFEKQEHHSIFIPDVDAKNSHWAEDVNTDTLGQFTGSYDKNRNEIYEGDILRFGNSPSGVCEVKWNKRITAFCVRFYFECNLGSRPLGEWVMCERSVEIIGNVHDNPELLKGGKNEK